MAQIVIGLVIGYMMGTINNNNDNGFDLPTEEMESRAIEKNYITDFLLALLCGFILTIVSILRYYIIYPLSKRLSFSLNVSGGN